MKNGRRAAGVRKEGGGSLRDEDAPEVVERALEARARAADDAVVGVGHVPERLRVVADERGGGGSAWLGLPSPTESEASRGETRAERTPYEYTNPFGKHIGLPSSESSMTRPDSRHTTTDVMWWLAGSSLASAPRKASHVGHERAGSPASLARGAASSSEEGLGEGRWEAGEQKGSLKADRPTASAVPSEACVGRAYVARNVVRKRVLSACQRARLYIACGGSRPSARGVGQRCATEDEEDRRARDERHKPAHAWPPLRRTRAGPSTASSRPCATAPTARGACAGRPGPGRPTARGRAPCTPAGAARTRASPLVTGERKRSGQEPQCQIEREGEEHREATAGRDARQSF